MSAIKKYGLIAVIIISVGVMVMIRLIGGYSFSPDAERWAEPSLNKTNILSLEQSEMLPGNKLIISNCDKNQLPDQLNNDIKFIYADSVFSKETKRILSNNKGPIMVYSEDISIGARIWMLVSQMGYEDVFLISDDKGNETFKNKTGLTN